MKVKSFLLMLLPLLGSLAAPTQISSSDLSRRYEDFSGTLHGSSTVEERREPSSFNEVESRAPKAVALTMAKQPSSFTWTGSMPAGFYTKAQALVYAKQGYTLMQTENPSGFDKDANGRFTRTTLVACLFIPGKGFSLGTAPGTAGFTFDKAQAPAWWHRVQNRQVLVNGRPKWHAEDVAMYTYEKSLTSKLAATATYPPHSYIVVWGHFGPLGTRPGDTTAMEKSVCGQSGTETISPSCFQALKSLEVGFK